jgi:hypothetical protein
MFCCSQALIPGTLIVNKDRTASSVTYTLLHPVGSVMSVLSRKPAEIRRKYLKRYYREYLVEICLDYRSVMTLLRESCRDNSRRYF